MHFTRASALVWPPALALMISLACALPGTNPLLVPRAARFIELGLRDTDTLACEAGRCEKWYRLAVRRNKRISIEVSSDADPVSTDFGIVLYDDDLEVITRNDAPYQRPRQLSAELEPGLYSLRIQKLTGLDSPLRYRLLAIAGPLSRFAELAPARPGDRPTSPGATDPPATAPKTVQPRTESPISPPPRPARRATRPTIPSTAETLPDKSTPMPMAMAAPGTLIRSEVIEVERTAGVPVAVLIEAGIPTGVSSGQQGRLVEADQEIGRVEIVDVYAAGSRARILGELTGAITASSVVEVFAPTE